jgi:hypothetical protein
VNERRASELDIKILRSVGMVAAQSTWSPHT